MKTRFFQAEMKEVELKEWSIKIKWFASTPDIDRYNDIVNPKAFKNAIEWYMTNPVILLQHNSDKPIWKTVDSKINKNWLNITVEITNDIDNVFKNIQDGILKGFSIWFIPKKWEYKMVWDKEIREITELDLIEVSVVSTPANASSLFSLSKSIKSFFEELKEDNIINNKETMKNEVKENQDVEKETTEQVEQEEVVTEEKENTEEQENEETTEENTEEKNTEEEITEWTNTVAPDKVETADENSAEETETETEEVEETSENDEETTEEESEEVENDEAGSELEKDFAAMKKELAEQKELLDVCVDTLMNLSNRTQEIKWVVEAMPIKRWLATLGGVQEKKNVDPLVQALMNAKENY